MEEIKTKAIVLNSKDYHEADKIVSIFSADYGKINVKFHGVKKEKAKLKALIQPFTLIDIECMKRGDFFNAKTGMVITSFSKISQDYKKTICAYIIVEILNQILPKAKRETEIFIETLNSLANIEKSNHYIATISFIVNFFKHLGEGLNLDLTSNKIYLDLNFGNFSAERTANSIEIDKKCYLALTDYSDNENVNKMCLKMLNNVIKTKYDVEINSFSFL